MAAASGRLASERALVTELHSKLNTFGSPDYARVANVLQRRHPQMFGAKSPGKPSGITRQDIKNIVRLWSEGEKADGRGRPNALPLALSEKLLATLASVVNARACIYSASLLQPIAIGTILASQDGHQLLNDGRAGKANFCCSIQFIRRLMKSNGWRNVKPQGDTRKLPSNWNDQRWRFVLRLAYLVFAHAIPQSLVVNADHTGIMFTPFKGSTWITSDMVAAKDKSVQGHGEKRQFTLLASTSAAGHMLNHQLVVQGRSLACLPADDAWKYDTCDSALNSKGSLSSCFSLRVRDMVSPLANISSCCCTSNHWSDDVTSRAYVTDVLVPYFKQKIAAIRAVDPNLCKPFGEQVCVLIVDCWWGWLDASFRDFVKRNYPWIRLLFVPAGCTPVAQPMDAGIIAKVKGILRTLYGRWACDLTVAQIEGGSKPEDVKIPSNVKTCRLNLFTWLSEAASRMRDEEGAKGIVHCWGSTQLLRAWDHEVQQEAAKMASELFGRDALPVLTGVLVVEVDRSGTEDREAAFPGLPFPEAEQPDRDWVQWVDWEKVTSSTGPSSY